jgi:hypothetical protein
MPPSKRSGPSRGHDQSHRASFRREPGPALPGGAPTNATPPALSTRGTSPGQPGRPRPSTSHGRGRPDPLVRPRPGQRRLDPQSRRRRCKPRDRMVTEATGSSAAALRLTLPLGPALLRRLALVAATGAVVVVLVPRRHADVPDVTHGRVLSMKETALTGGEKARSVHRAADRGRYVGCLLDPSNRALTATNSRVARVLVKRQMPGGSWVKGRRSP